MFVGAARWLSQRLATLIWPHLPRSTLGAFALPPEIILIIAANLANVHVISLALTCRNLFSLCYPRRPCLNTAEKEELLLLLEKDIPTLYYCYYCAKLHRWRSSWVKTMYTCIGNDLPCLRDLDYFLFFPHSCHISYNHARLVMNAHFYGPAHGISPRKLETRIRSTDTSRKIKDDESLHARIVDDSLLVLSVKSISHSRGDSKAIRDYIDTWGSSVCQHLALGRGCPDYAPMQLPELDKDKSSPGHFAPCDQSFGSCTFCPTDYCIDITWCGKRKGYVIRVSAYRQLGACRSPLDWSWRSMTTRKTTREPLRTAYPLEYGIGAVRDRWHEVKGSDSGTRGVWVDIPGLVSRR